MSETPLKEDSTNAETLTPVARRAFVVSDEEDVADALSERLKPFGFEIKRASGPKASQLIEQLAPTIALIVFGKRDDESRLVTLARRLRTETATFALPLVFLFREDSRTLRSAALRVGADDYFALDAPRDELRARLDALLWRVEAGRRAAPTVAEQRDEIDNFIFLLDAVAVDAHDGRTGALALVEARRNKDGEDGVQASGDVQVRTAGDRPALAEAHGFLKLNLRRVDAVTFYGPATLLVYLPGAGASAARSTLAALREEFSGISTDRDGDFSVGISSFPAHGTEVERLVEQAEAALEKARSERSHARVVVYESGVPTLKPPAEASDIASARVVTKPRTEDRNDASTSSVAVATPSSERRAGGKMRRLMLVVSDAARMAQVNLLMRSAGYEVRAAFDGQHALNLLRIDRPDLLVVDYELSGMDGVEMLRRLGKQSGARRPPALMLVPMGREDLRHEASEAGARGFVNLPYDAVELLDALDSFAGSE